MPILEKKKILNKGLNFCLKKLKKREERKLNERKEIMKIRMETEIENREERKLTKSDFILWKD